MSLLDKFLSDNFGNESFTPGLERIKEAISSTSKKLKSKIVIIAGTNGKGECSYSLAQILNDNKISNAVWSSPHISSVSERFNFNGELISEELLLDKAKVLLADLKRRKLSLSYYEFLFYLFINLAESYQPEVLILEVGLGGRLDAVNSLDCDIAAITSISRDHQEFLGSRLDQILSEKFAVSRSGKALITAFSSSYLLSLTEILSLKNGVKLDDIHSRYKSLIKTYSHSNRLIALELYKNLFNNSNLPTVSELMSFSFRGRFDKIKYENKEVVFCGAHNLDGLRKMFSLICREDKKKYCNHSLVVSFSKRNKNDLINMVKIINEYKNLFSSVNFCEFEHFKAASFENLNNEQVLHDWKGFIANEQKIFITGSYYFIGQVQGFLSSPASNSSS